MKKQISTLAGIIIIVVVAVIFFGGVFVYQYFSAKANNQLQVKNQTAGWKTYTNTQYGFEIQYPIGSQIKDNLDSDRGSPGVSFTVPNSNVGQSYIFYVNVETKAWLIDNTNFKGTYSYCDDFNPTPTSSVNINGINFTKGDVSYASAALRSNTTEYCVVRGDIAYKLSPSIQYAPSYGNATEYNTKGFNTTIDVNNDPVFNQMVSTFKFEN